MELSGPITDVLSFKESRIFAMNANSPRWKPSKRSIQLARVPDSDKDTLSDRDTNYKKSKMLNMKSKFFDIEFNKNLSYS